MNYPHSCQEQAGNSGKLDSKVGCCKHGHMDTWSELT